VKEFTNSAVSRRCKSAGWLKSAVFGKSFRLHRANDEQGNPEFTLEAK